MFYIRVRRGTVPLSSEEFAPVAEAEAHLWARRQLKALKKGR